MAECVDQSLSESPFVKFGNHRRKQTHGQLRAWIPGLERLGYLFYGFEQRATVGLIHLDVGTHKNLKSRLIRRNKPLQRFFVADKQQPCQSRRQLTIDRHNKAQRFLQVRIRKLQKIPVTGLIGSDDFAQAVTLQWIEIIPGGLHHRLSGIVKSAQIRKTGGNLIRIHGHTFWRTIHCSPLETATALFIAEHAPTGEERPATILQRVNQSYFRNSLLQNYHGTCCITGMQIPKLLIASHIKPWKASTPNEKTAASNGLLLNAFHDRAFDQGLISIDDDYRIMVNHDKVRHSDINDRWLYDFDGHEISLPAISQPSHEFIEYHHKHIFLANAA